MRDSKRDIDAQGYEEVTVCCFILVFKSNLILQRHAHASPMKICRDALLSVCQLIELRALKVGVLFSVLNFFNHATYYSNKMSINRNFTLMKFKNETKHMT